MNVEHSGDPFIKDSMREFGETMVEMSALAERQVRSILDRDFQIPMGHEK